MRCIVSAINIPRTPAPRAVTRPARGDLAPQEVARVRVKLGLTQRAAGAVFGGGVNAFSRYETGKARPPVALVRLLQLLDRHPHLLGEISAGEDSPALPLAADEPGSAAMTMMPKTAATAAREPVPLAPHERAAYRAALVQTQAIFALEGMEPSETDRAIDAAILAGRVAPERAREELLAYLLEHKTMRGFIESRTWAH